MQEIENDCLCHVSVGKASAAKDNTAPKQYRYINRLDHTKIREDLVYSTSINMPEFAKDKPEFFWECANKYESFNGRQAVLIEIALPRDLNIRQNIALTKTFVRELTVLYEGDLPCSYGIHYKRETNNPHFHAMIYERPICKENKHQPPELFFKKANRNNPSKGGVRKVQKYTMRDFPKWLRNKWAEIANRFLERFGFRKRINPLSYKDRGLDMIPQIHLGPTSSYNLKKGIIDERIKKNIEIQRLNARTSEEIVKEELDELKAFYRSSLQRDFRIYRVVNSFDTQYMYSQAVYYKELLGIGNIEEYFNHWWEFLGAISTYKRMQNVIFHLISECYSKEAIIKACIKKDIEEMLHFETDELYECYEEQYNFVYHSFIERIDFRDVLGDLLLEIEDAQKSSFSENEKSIENAHQIKNISATNQEMPTIFIAR